MNEATTTLTRAGITKQVWAGCLRSVAGGWGAVGARPPEALVIHLNPPVGQANKSYKRTKVLSPCGLSGLWASHIEENSRGSLGYEPRGSLVERNLTEVGVVGWLRGHRCSRVGGGRTGGNCFGVGLRVDRATAAAQGLRWEVGPQIGAGQYAARQASGIEPGAWLPNWG